MTPAVSVTGATVRFGQTAALDEVSVTIAEGVTFGVVGESGSGKTTLMRAILGLQRLDKGDVRLLGERLQPGTEGFRARAAVIQPIFQDPAASLSPRRRIGALMDEVSHVLGEERDATRERLTVLLDRMGVPMSALSRYPHEISGGQARRIAIARALLMKPRILVADEPTAGLDVSVQGDLLNLLQDIRESSGITLIVVSHNLAVVRLIADQVAVMMAGRVMETGAAGDVFDHPAQSYSRELIASWPTVSLRHASSDHEPRTNEGRPMSTDHPKLHDM